MNELEQINLSRALETLVSSTVSLEEYWNAYLNKTYTNSTDLGNRDFFEDMGEIKNYMIQKFKDNQTHDFIKIFDVLENILTSWDEMTCSIISAGLLERFHMDKTIDYYFGFNIWMKPKTKEWWDGGIDYWEGEMWRQKNGC